MNSGYRQIPCAARGQPIGAFSPDYGFGQWTWNVMLHGIKPASSLFQQTMEQTFSDLGDCILPPFYDNVCIKGSDFQQHLPYVRRVPNSTIWFETECLEMQVFPNYLAIFKPYN